MRAVAVDASISFTHRTARFDNVFFMVSFCSVSAVFRVVTNDAMLGSELENVLAHVSKRLADACSSKHSSDRVGHWRSRVWCGYW